MGEKPIEATEAQLLTVEEAADVLALSRSSVYALMESGQLPYVKILRARRIRLADVRALVEGNLVGRRID